MRLGCNVGYWSSAPPDGMDELVVELEQLGFDSLWTAEAYGSDVFTPLAWWGARTSRLRLGTAIAQISARTPTATAMAAMTLDHLSGGRAVLGLGVSGPQVVEGWYGRPFAKPLSRTREYVDVIRQVLAREAPVTSDGPHYPLPYPDGTGLGRPLKPIVHPVRPGLPVMLAAEGPRNVALSAELADGWLPLFYSPYADDHYRETLEEGFARRTARSPRDDFDVVCTVPVAIDDDLEMACDRVRPYLALYMGGMGAKNVNFHHDVFVRMGAEQTAKRVQELYLDGRKDEAAAAVPTELVEQVALVGPPAKIRDELDAWRESLVTTMLVSGPPAHLRAVAELVLS